MLLQPKTLLSCALFLILNSCASAQKPTATRVDLRWEFPDLGPGATPLACLPEDDVVKLREALIRCEAK